MKPYSLIVRTMADIVFPFILVFGLYLVIHGHLTPGGGFQGGVVVAASVAILYVAYGETPIRGITKKLSAIESIGALAFLGLALTGITTAFFFNILWAQRLLLSGAPGTLSSAGQVLPMNLAVSVKVFGGIAASVLTIAIYRRGGRDLG